MKESLKIIIILSLASILSIACADQMEYEEPNAVSNYGFNLYYEGSQSYAAKEIDYTASIVIATLEDIDSENFPEGSIVKAIEPYYEHMSITIAEEKTGPKGSCATHEDKNRACRGFQCENSQSKWCQGLYDPNLVHIKVAHKKCIADSALAHELIHLFSHLANNDGDSSHANKKYFGSHGSVTSVAKKMISEKYCSGAKN